MLITSMKALISVTSINELLVIYLLGQYPHKPTPKVTAQWESQTEPELPSPFQWWLQSPSLPEVFLAVGKNKKQQLLEKSGG